MALDGDARRRTTLLYIPQPWRAHGCVEVMVLAISSALGWPTRIVSLLTLVLVLAGCQGLASGGGGGEPAPHGTLSANPPSLSFGNVVVGKNRFPEREPAGGRVSGHRFIGDELKRGVHDERNFLSSGP